MKEIFSFVTDPDTCPYLADQSAQQEVKIVTRVSAVEYSQKLSQGWRRFGSGLFRPACRACRECVPIRVLAQSFAASRSQRRVLRRNRDIGIEIGAPMIDEARLRLYERFHQERAKTRGWVVRAMEPDEYINTFLENAAPTLEFRYSLQGKLIGIAYVGEGDDAFNSVYAFSDPTFDRRGLGTFDVLTEISEARRRGKAYVYLGFYVKGCSSMVYKAAFRPHQILENGSWNSVELSARIEDR